MLLVNLLQNAVMMSLNVNIWVEGERALASHFGLRFADMFFVEKELSVQIADVDCVQIDLKSR